MPGLVGLITQMPEPQAREQLARMVQAIHHEPFYTCGTWADPSIGVYIGWVARQGSFSEACQCTTSTAISRSYFPARITPNREQRRSFGSAVTTSRWMVQHTSSTSMRMTRLSIVDLNGMFHGVIVDRNHGTATLFVDRYGMQRVYFHKSRDAFYFAAEAKAILAVCAETRAVNPASLGEFISFGCTLQNRSLFEKVHLLPPASAWVFRRGLLQQQQTYFDPQTWEQQEPLDAEAYYLEMRDVVSHVLPRYVHWGRTGSDCTHGRTGHTRDHGMEQGSVRIAPLLHIRGHDAREP